MLIDRVFVFGLNHKFAPLALREKLAFSAERLPVALYSLRSAFEPNGTGNGAAQTPELVLLSTCNRTEVYGCGEDPQGAIQVVLGVLADHAGMATDELEGLSYAHCGGKAAQHLLRVAAGLDSLVAGENEILGQVKCAYQLAHESGSSGPVLSALFRCAVQAGKRVRSETDLGRSALSVASVVVELAQETLGSLQEHTALLVGAGKISSMTARALVEAGLRCVLIANRTFERAQRLADSLGPPYASAVHFDALSQCLAEADIVICSTGAPHIVLRAETVSASQAGRPERPLLVADLAVPRDVDPAVAELPGVALVDIDDLEHQVRKRHPLSLNVRQAAEAIVVEELAGFENWCQARNCVPVIRALRSKAEAICQEQVEQTIRRLGALTPEQQEAIESMGQAIIGKLLHEPIVFLKEPPEEISPEERSQLVENVFGLN